MYIFNSHRSTHIKFNSSSNLFHRVVDVVYAFSTIWLKIGKTICFQRISSRTFHILLLHFPHSIFHQVQITRQQNSLLFSHFMHWNQNRKQYEKWWERESEKYQRKVFSESLRFQMGTKRQPDLRSGTKYTPKIGSYLFSTYAFSIYLVYFSCRFSLHQTTLPFENGN